MINCEFQYLTVRSLRQLQNKRIAEIVQYSYRNSTFYRDLFDKVAIAPSDITTTDELNKIPFTTKNDLRLNYPFRMFAVDRSKICRIHCSSGTSGKPTTIGYTQQDIRLFSEVMARSLQVAGVTPGMVLQNAYGYGLFTGGLGFHYGAEQLGTTVVPVSGGMIDRQLLLMQDFQTAVLCCTPSYAQTIAEEINNRRIDPQQLNIQLAILGGEPWTESVRHVLESILPIKATNHYGLSEIIGPGVAQEDVNERGSGSYIWEDYFYPEIVDPLTNEPVEEGKPGVLVLTTLVREAMPLLRYRTNDITTLYADTSGKRPFRKIGPILGRADDMLIIRGVNFFPSQLEELLIGFQDLSLNYQIVVTKTNYLDSVDVNVELRDIIHADTNLFGSSLEIETNTLYLQNLKHRIKRKVKESIGLSMNINLAPKGSLPRSEGGKLNRVRDLRNEL